MRKESRPMWISTPYSRVLSGRQNRNTAPELALRRSLFRRGLRYRLNRKVAFRTKADIVFPKQRVAVFVDGCFWHCCPKHGRTDFTGPNARTWERKLAGNKARDSRATESARRQGWTVVRVWECEIKSHLERVTRKICAKVRH